MASLVIAMQLRQIFYQIDARLKRHRNYRRIVAVLDQQLDEVLEVEAVPRRAAVA